MEDVQITLAVLWVALMLTYLLGDVTRIFAGDFVAGEIMGKKVGQGLWVGIAAFMTIPIVMVVLSVTVNGDAMRWPHVIAAAGLLLFNLAGLPTYPGWYDRFLIVVGLVLNGLTIVYALRWV